MNDRPPIDEHAIAEALGDLEKRRARGESASVFDYRERLGESHSAFLEVLETEAVLDELLDPPPEEGFPRDFGPFTLLRELGHGAMGVVYEGVHKQLGRRAAVKVIRRGFDADTQARERFRRETRACAQVRHPHVVEIYEAGEVDGRPFYAMGLVDGRSLSGLIKAGEVPGARALARSMAGIADALEALHKAGVVHRDVKPSNLMVRQDGHLLLADFGHARVGDGLGLTATGETLGTPLYMSPEQLLNAKGGVDARSDVYALGATLYEALAGRPVFQADDFASLARKILEERPEPLRKVAPQVPAPLEAIVMKALEKLPRDRYGSAAAMRDDLLAFAGGGRVAGRPVGALVHFSRVARRHAVPIAAALVAVLGGTWWWTHRPATFRIDSVPAGAEVLVGGAARGTTPLEFSLAPGPYDVTLRLAGFADRTRHVELAAGSSRDIELPLAVVERPGGGDFAARDLAMRSVGVDLARLERPSGTRAGPSGFTVLWPRRDVRLEDLADWAVEANDYPKGSVVEFVRGASEVVYSERLEAEDSYVRRPIPESVRAALREGDLLRFGLRLPARRPGDLARGSSTFRIVRSNADAVIAEAERRMGEQPESVLAEMRLRILLHDDLRTAAVRQIEDLPTTVKDDPRVTALTRRVYEDLGLADTARGQAVTDRIAHFPDEVYERVYGAPRPEASGR